MIQIFLCVVLFVQKELLSLKRNKSPGIDNLPPNLLKDGAREIAKPLCHLINQSLKESAVPTEWKHSKITPIHKSGTLENPDNYRPSQFAGVVKNIRKSWFTSK